ncbi:MAG: porin, partial [Planctomycetota bacterium]
LDELIRLRQRLDWLENAKTPIDSQSTHDVIYDGGWMLRPRDASATPFQMRIGLHSQFRYTNFGSDIDSFVDAAGNATSIRDRNDFDINRGRLVFDGFVFDEDVGYYVNIDFNTVSPSPIQLLLSWISFRCSDALTLYLGLGKLPGSWEWEQSSRFPLGIERTLATTFFRPSISAGLWATGSFAESVFYRAMIADGFNTFSLRAAELDTNFAYSTLWWWEPLRRWNDEEFGVGFSDHEHHRKPSVRLGHGLTQNTNDETFLDSPGPEQTVIRLSDGTRLVTPDALQAGETVGSFDQWLYTIHAGVKFRGWSLSSEGFFRWLRNIQSVDGDDLRSLFDSGFFVQAGAFVVPERVELFARTSEVHGDFGQGRELSAGLNWYLFSTRSARGTIEITELEDSPAQQSRTAFVAGGNGTIVQAQLWTFF